MDEDRLRAVLREMGYTDEDIHLERTSTGKFGGFIVSEAFRGESQINRQNQLWHQLERRLAPQELVRIVSLLTLTPDEAAKDED